MTSATDHDPPFRLDDLQIAALDAVLDLIIPPSAARGLPGAAEVGVLDYLQSEAPAGLVSIAEALDRLDAESGRRFGAPMAALEKADQHALIEALKQQTPTFLDGLAFETYSCYYQDDRVLDVIGLEKRAPYPKGYDVIAGDLNLLGPVRRRGPIYREA